MEAAAVAVFPQLCRGIDAAIHRPEIHFRRQCGNRNRAGPAADGVYRPFLLPRQGGVVSLAVRPDCLCRRRHHDCGRT